MTTTSDAKERAADAAEELRSRSGADDYDAIVVLGSGWARTADFLGPTDIELDVTELPGFVAPTAAGHSTKVRSLWAGERRVAVFLGRAHLYEVGDPMQVAHAVRTGVSAGADTVVLTGSAGALRADFSVGQPVVLRDHINLTATSPLVGPDFVDLTEAYSPRLRRVAQDADSSLTEGVYASLTGPQFQTPAELGMLRNAGADLVGRSIALETIAAVEMGAEVLGLAVVTNDAMRSVLEPFDSEQALGVADQRAQRLAALLEDILAR